MPLLDKMFRYTKGKDLDFNKQNPNILILTKFLSLQAIAFLLLVSVVDHRIWSCICMLYLFISKC